MTTTLIRHLTLPHAPHCSHSKQTVMTILPDLNEEELKDLSKVINAKLVEQRDARRKRAKRTFQPGDRVKFYNNKTAGTMTGILDRVKRKFAVVKHCEDGKSWNVPAENLIKA
jgi:hypothetical protein